MIYLTVLIILLLLSGFFSGTETAMFNLKTHRDEVHNDIRKMLQNPRRLLVSLLTGNTIVNVLMASIAALLVTELADHYQLPKFFIILSEVVVVTFIVLVFGEIVPKIIAIRKSQEFVRTVRLPLRFFITLLYPFAYVLYGVVKLVMTVLPVKKEKIFDSEEELKILAKVGEEQGAIQSEESEMIQSIYEFHRKMVHEVMTPRVDMIALPSNTSLKEVMELICEKQFSKIPIYRDNIDDIRGILYAKDILPYLSGPHPNVNLASISRTPFFVPETKELDELLDDFREKKTSIAIVVDEWGGTSGLVTLEDVVEEVIGEIRDPYDQDDFHIKKLKEGGMLVDARLGIYDLEEETDLEFPEERDYDTLGGFILNEMKEMPKVGESIQYRNRKYTVTRLEGNRIHEVLITPVANGSDEEEKEENG